jgi:lipoate-protein ligase A
VREGTLLLHREGFPARPAFDTAVSRALLEGAASGAPGDTLRLFVPGRVLAFGTADTGRPGYPAAVEAARAEGFAPMVRLAGGRAAVFHEETLAFAWARPDPDPPRRIHARFRELADIVVEALGSLGAEARVGEVPGEYCPGSYSVSLAGRGKVMGVGQRLVAGAAHVGGVVVVRGAELVNRALTPVYRALAYTWDPAATGSVDDGVAGATVGLVADALVAALARRYRVAEAPLPPAALERAEALAAAAPPPG